MGAASRYSIPRAAIVKGHGAVDEPRGGRPVDCTISVVAWTSRGFVHNVCATERYLALLRSGGNGYPMKQLRNAGVDLAQARTVQAVIEQMDELVSRMEAEAARIGGWIFAPRKT